MPSEWENNSSSSSAKVSSSSASSLSASSSTATSPEPNANGNNNNNNDSAKNGHGKDCALKASTMSHDHTPYVARARVTRPTPPKPSCNPMQFVQIKPCNLYQSAQQQLKKAEEIKKVKEVMKEEPEDWQNNLDNWKSSRRKRVEHIIERVVEVKKLEEEEHDRTRRKSKTFSEMMEERGERGRTRPKLQSLASYNEDEANDLSDLGIGTSSASGKSSISEDCEVHSIVSEPAEVENLSSFDIENNSCQPCHDNDSRDRISSPGYETSSTAPVASPDPYEYTYEGAIEDYKSRVSKATASSIYKKSDENSVSRNLLLDRKPTDDTELSAAAVKMEDLPKIDITKKRELFEKPEVIKKLVTPSSGLSHDQIEKKPIPSEFANVRSIKDRLCSLEKKPESTEETTTGILTGETPPSIKERLQCLEQQKQQNSVNPKPNTNKVVAEVVAVPPLKDRLSSLQNAVTKEEIVKKPVVLVDEYQLEMLKNEELARRQLELDTSKDDVVEKAPSDDSGINTTDEKIDHEPTEDEDGDDEEEEDDDDKQSRDGRPQMHEEKVPPSASTNEFQGEFDSSVSFLQLKSLNTPTVVSLVDKPVVVDVVGGGGGDKSNKIVHNDENREVNHAQNLLKMFKMAFTEDDIVEESKVEEIVVDRNKSEGVSQLNQSKMKDTSVPWRKTSETVVKASKIPQGSAAKVEENMKKSLIQASKIPQGVSKAQISSPKIDQVEIEIPINTQADLGIVEIVKKSLSETLVVKHPQAESEISNVANNSQEKESRKSVMQKINSIEGILKEGSNISLKPSEAMTSRTTPAKVQQQNVSKPAESAISVDKPRTPVESPIPLRKLESPISSRKVTAGAENISRYGAKPHDLVSNLILNIDNSQKKSMIPIASKSQQSSPVTPVNSSPIYENVGLKKAGSSSESNGRIEIFNSKSMASKPKSPEVLPRGIKSYPPEDVKSEILSKDFQQTALNDFLGDLESWQPKIVGEQPKHSAEEAAIENSVSQNSEQIVQKTNVAPKEPPRSLQSLANPLTPEKTADVSKIEESKKNFESTSKLSSPDKTVASTDPLPFESCVDILQSFLAAERSYAAPASSNESEIIKKSNPSDVFLRQETVVEVPCSKLDVKDLPDPNFIRTPCIDVDCGAQSPKVQLRDSISSSAGDSSPSSEITVIFKPNASPIPGSPTPNKSSLMQIANRVSSPIAGRRNPPQPVHENPCLKLDVKDLPDPNFIRTPCINVDKKVLTECNAQPLSPSTPTSWLHKANAEVLKKTCDEISNTPPLSPVLGRASSPSVEKPNFLIARVEVVETKIKVTTSNDAEAPPAVPESQPPPMVVESPKLSRKSATNSKPKNIFEFLKKNFQSKPDPAIEPVDEFEPISVDNSMFYVPSDVIASSSSKAGSPSDPQTNNGVNIEIIKTITTDSIVEQTDSELNLTDEINEILDEEISKLVVEDANL